MAYNYEYPYTDPNRYNSDWIINRVKELSLEWIETRKEWNNTQEEFASLKAFIQNYFAQLDLQDEVNVKLDIMARDGSLSALISPLFSEYKKEIDRSMSEQNDKINVLNSRMDTFTSLPDGSTAGDAELQDIRIGYNGKVYPSAGDAVRMQVSQLSSEIEIVSNDIYGRIFTNNIINFDTNYINGKYISEQTGDIGTNEIWMYNENYIEVNPSSVYSFLGVNNGYLIVAFYNENKEFLFGSHSLDKTYTFKTSELTRYIRYSVVQEYKNCVLIKDVNSSHLNIFKHSIIDDIDKKYLSDVNNAIDNMIYRLQLSNITLDNMPSDFPQNSTLYWLVCITNSQVKYSSTPVKIQYLCSADNSKIYYRTFFRDAWDDWKVISDKYSHNIITCGEGKMFTRLRDAIAEGCKYGSTVVVYPGIYDLKNEFPNVQTNHDAHGIDLYGGVYVKFLAGSYVKAIFDNSDRWIYDHFEPFHSVGDFTLDGLNIEAANTRYCVHDEHSGVGTQHHIYKNCVMKYTNEHDDINYVQCIGGGLGEHGYIEIDGGYYESKTTVGLTPFNLAVDDSQHPISYHNGDNPNCDSKIVIKNVYLADKGYFRFGMYGSSEIKSKILISGCSMHKPIWNMYENSNYNVENFEVIEFNNTIRNA